MNNRKKQFIAGAVCPSCSEMDSLVLFSDDQSVACVSCNFEQTSEQRDQSAKQENSSKEPVQSQTDSSVKMVNLINITNLDD